MEQELQSVQTQEPTPVKKSKKGIIITIVIALILLILAVAGTWYYMDQRVASEKKTAEDQKAESDKKISDLYKQIDDLKKSSSSTTTSNSATPSKTPTQVVTEFYSWYLSGTRTYQKYSQSTDLTDTFKQKLDKSYAEMSGSGSGADLVLLAQNNPISVTNDSEKIIGEYAVVMSHHKYGSPGQYNDHPILIILKKIGDEWKIDDIIRADKIYTD